MAKQPTAAQTAPAVGVTAADTSPVGHGRRADAAPPAAVTPAAAQAADAQARTAFIDAAGESTPSPLTGVEAAVFDATAAAERSRVDAAVADHLTAANARLSPPLASPRAMPLPPVQMVGTKGSAAPDLRGVDPVFDRRGTVEKLLTHPDAEVRQRAQEAQVAIHHGAADIGIKVRAALDFAKNREATR